jgi:hypothetical protein
MTVVNATAVETLKNFKFRVEIPGFPAHVIQTIVLNIYDFSFDVEYLVTKDSACFFWNWYKKDENTVRTIKIFDILGSEAVRCFVLHNCTIDDVQNKQLRDVEDPERITETARMLFSSYDVEAL